MEKTNFYPINYDVSLYPTKKWIAMNNKRRKLVRIYLSKLTEYIKKFFDDDIYNLWINYDDGFAEFLLNDIILYTLIERICLEVSFHKPRLKDKCKGYKDCECKIEYVVNIILGFLGWKTK